MTNPSKRNFRRKISSCPEGVGPNWEIVIRLTLIPQYSQFHLLKTLSSWVCKILFSRTKMKWKFLKESSGMKKRSSLFFNFFFFIFAQQTLLGLKTCSNISMLKKIKLCYNTFKRAKLNEKTTGCHFYDTSSNSSHLINERAVQPTKKKIHGTPWKGR